MAAHGLRGFTLVEVLVALSLLALTGVIAWRGLDQVSSQRARADAVTLATDRVLRSLAQMERDFGQHIPDALFAARTDTGGTLPRAVKVFVGAEGNIRLDVLRRLPSPHGVRNVAYSVKGSSLVRQLLTGDEARDEDSVVMLEAVRRMDVRLLIGGRWVPASRVTPGSGRAAAIEVAIERENGERYDQILQL
jgi:general secretion pathway protein J